MKLKHLVWAFALGAVVWLSGCGDENAKAQQEGTLELRVGATPVPHAKILEIIKEDLQKEGIRLNIVEFSDYVTPNLSLNDGSLDANFFQHKPYLYDMNKERKLDLVAVADIHIEPMGFYSAKLHDITALAQGSTIAIPNDPTNGGRALILLHNKGLITLKDPSNLASTQADIIENPKGFKIISIEAALLPRIVKEYEGAVINSNFAIPAGFSSKDALIIEDRSSPYVNVLVVPVMKDMRQQPAQTLQVKYPAAAAPTVTFKLSKSYINVGETSTITAKGTGKPTAWKWTLPEELELVEGALTDSKITVMGLKAGRHSVTVEATNSVGTSTTTKEVLDVMEAGEEKEVYNVVLKKTVVSYSDSTNSTEVPSKIIDGVERPNSTGDKWCNVSADNWVIFDLEGAYRIYGFKIFDGNSGPESGVDQIRSYTIELSDDGEHWTTVVDEEDRESESIKTDYIAPHKARYVRLSPHVNGTLRIWEFEVFGKDDSNLTIKVMPTELKLNAEETKNVVVKYSVSGDEHMEDFTCHTVSEKDNLTIGDITHNIADDTFIVPVTANKVIGEDKLTISVGNNDSYKERTVKVIIDTEKQTNVLAGAEATLRHYKSDWSFDAEYEGAYNEFKVNTLTDNNKTDEACGVVETPSMYKQDFWAIFTAPEEKSWNLSKVKIYIPNDNQSENDNGKIGSANNEISIIVGSDPYNLTTIKTFSNINKVSELEYILPEYRNCKYLAIVCTLNPFFYPTLAEVEAFEQFTEAIPAKIPVSVKGFNCDVIAESKPSSEFVSETIDNDGWYFYSSAVQEKGAIAADDRIVKTNSGTEFRLADYSENNALKLNAYEDGVLTFDNPEKCMEIYILAVSANGESDMNITVNYDDDTSGSTSTFTAWNWYAAYGPDDEAVYGLSRIKTTDADDTYKADEIDNNYTFRLYEFKLPADIKKKVKSVSFKSLSSGSHLSILAVSKKGYHVTTGITSTVDGQVEKRIQGIYTINGIKLETLQKGINIIRYTDGTAKKVIIR